VETLLDSGSFFADRYRVDELLGAGAQKQTYRAWDTKASRPVALAVLAPDSPLCGHELEATVLARVGPHDNIVTMYDFGVANGRQFLVLEYLPGGELRDHCRAGVYQGGQVPLPDFFRWARQLCRAVSQIHGHKIIHRDISASNIWLDARRVAHLGDFDAAFVLDDPDSAADDYSTTESFMAPELMAGATGDARTDIYSLGAVFYELLTGQEPSVPADSAPALAAPSSLRPDVPPILDDLVLSMLACAPDDRPASADAVLAALRKIEPAADLEAMIRQGENETVEFKQTLRLDTATGKTSNEILKASMKALCSLLNAHGGTLLIGVADNGDLTGIEPDLAAMSTRPNLDGFEQAFRQGMINYLQPDASHQITLSFPVLRGVVQICRADVRPSPQPVFILDKNAAPEFPVRKGNTSRALDVKAAHDYIREHWNWITTA
jgi:serine/threonine protein kinase